MGKYKSEEMSIEVRRAKAELNRWKADRYGIFSLAYGHLGKCLLDGREVKAIACCPKSGWTVCHTKADGSPVLICERSEIAESGDKVRKALIYGDVQFTLREDSNG